MTPDAIRAARARLGLSVAEFARALSVEPQTVRRWEMDPARNSYRAPSGTVATLIDALLAMPKTRLAVHLNTRGVV